MKRGESRTGATVPALFVLWTWEPEYNLRQQIVGALPLNDQPNVGVIWKYFIAGKFSTLNGEVRRAA